MVMKIISQLIVVFVIQIFPGINSLKLRVFPTEVIMNEIGNIAEVDCNPTNSTSSNTTAHDCETGSIGWLNNKHYNIDKPPFKLISCSQILKIKGNTILDYDDCTKIESAFFTISPYMVNYFKNQNRTSLLKSIPIENMTQLPLIVPGFKKECLDFVDSKQNERFAICTNSKEDTISLQKAFIDYLKCRIGNNLQPIAQPNREKCKDSDTHLIRQAKLTVNTSFYKLTPPGS